MDVAFAERVRHALKRHVRGAHAFTITYYGDEGGIRLTVYRDPKGKKGAPTTLAVATMEAPPPDNNATQAAKDYCNGLIGAAVVDMRRRAAAGQTQEGA